MENTVIIVRDAWEDFEYALLVVPNSEVGKIQRDIKKAAKLIYSEDEDFAYDNLVNYIYDTYGHYVEHTPIVIKVE